MLTAASATARATEDRVAQQSVSPPAHCSKDGALGLTAASLPLFLQPKLAISQPGDPSEIEADRVADQVMRMSVPTVQRQCAACAAGESSCPACEEEEPVRVSRKAQGATRGDAPASVDSVLRAPGQPLGSSARAFFEPRFGRDLGEVRVHTDQAAQQSAQAVNALAYTVGAHVVFGTGRYAPGTPDGQRLLAHELTHVAQQSVDDGVSAKLQRAPLPCTSRKTLDVYAINLPGAMRTPSGDIANANASLCQCGLSLNLVGGQSWQTNLLDKQSPNKVLNEYSSPGNPTDEEKEMLAYQPGGDALHLYYVPSLSSGNEAEAFWTSSFPTVNNGVAISDSARPCAVAHEIGHVLLNDGGHHPNKDNLMAAGSVNTCAGELEQMQCNKMP
jgi:hypothetical protein